MCSATRGEADGVFRRSIDPLQLYDEIVSASPYADLSWETFERIVDFVATGGYALRTYERYARIRKTAEGRWRVSNPAVAQQYRVPIFTVVLAFNFLGDSLRDALDPQSSWSRGGDEE